MNGLWGHPPLIWEVEGRGSEWEQHSDAGGLPRGYGSRVENGRPLAGSVPASGPTALGRLPVLSGPPPAASHFPRHWHQCCPHRLSSVIAEPKGSGSGRGGGGRGCEEGAP